MVKFLWQWLKRRKAGSPKRSQRPRQPPDPRIAQAFSRVRGDVRTLQNGIKQVESQLQNHSLRIDHHDRRLTNHDGRLTNLEQRVTSQVPVFALSASKMLPDQTTNRTIPDQSATNPLTEIDWNELSPQERRIMEVFANHPGMALSYGDIAKSLQKSPHTVKNQMRQLMMKQPVFEKQVDQQQKNRFRLKKTVEKPLKESQD